MTISPPVATATDAPLALMDCLSDPRGTVSPRQRGDPVDAGKPWQLVVHPALPPLRCGIRLRRDCGPAGLESTLGVGQALLVAVVQYPNLMSGKYRPR